MLLLSRGAHCTAACVMRGAGRRPIISETPSLCCLLCAVSFLPRAATPASRLTDCARVMADRRRQAALQRSHASFALPPVGSTRDDAKRLLEALLEPRWSTAATFGSACLTGLFSMAATAATFAAWVRRTAPPQLHYAPTESNRRLISDMPLITRHYIPNLLSWNKHLAGIFGYVKLPGRKPHSTERITLPDGGTISLSWNAEPVDGASVVLLLPGINNETSLPYVRHLMGVLKEEGRTVAAMDWRGLGASGGLTGTTCTPKPYCAVCDGDVASVLEHLQAKLPASPLFAIGFSLGAGMLLRYMGVSGDRCLLTAAMAVSPSLDVAANYHHMHRGLTQLYLPVIILPLVSYLFSHRKALATGDDPVSFVRDVLPALRHRFGLDALYAKIWKLEGGVDEYHKIGSAVHVLPNIRRKTLMVHSADDPICPASAMPLDVIAHNPNLVAAITKHGGHMGYTAGVSPLAHTWTDRLLVHFLNHFRDSEIQNEAVGGASMDTLASPAASGAEITASAAGSPSVDQEHSQCGRSSRGTSATSQAPPIPIFHVPSRL